MANKKAQNNSEKKQREGLERRGLPRLKREVIVQYKIKELPPLGGVQVSLEPYVDITRTKDLSERGVSFTGGHAFSSGTILDIKLQLPVQKEPVELEGRVVGCEEINEKFIYEIRVKFININDEQKQLLRSFIQSFLKDKGQ